MFDWILKLLVLLLTIKFNLLAGVTTIYRDGLVLDGVVGSCLLA